MKLGYENGVNMLNDISGFDNQNKINFVSKNKVQSSSMLIFLQRIAHN